MTETSKISAPLTPAQQADVVRWMALGARIAARSAVMQPADADDAIGEAWLQMCRSVRTYDPVRGFKLSTHLGDGVRYAMLAVYQDRARQGFAGLKGKGTAAGMLAHVRPRVGLDHALELAAVEPADGPAPDPRLVAALAALPDRHRVAVTWRYLDGLKLDEIGARLGVTKERARQLVAAGVKNLRAYFGVGKEFARK